MIKVQNNIFALAITLTLGYFQFTCDLWGVYVNIQYAELLNFQSKIAKPETNFKKNMLKNK